MPQKRPYKKPYHKTKKKRFNTLKIRPGLEPSLTKVFERIGIPQQADFIPDQFQIDAVKAIEQSDCLVTAPTGSGKTWIAEQAIAAALKKGQSVWFGTPLKALTNTIYARFTELFGIDSVGILTGDIKENSNAPIIVGTTEIFRNQLYDSMHRGDNLRTDLVILDEAHYLSDPDRGVVWEEIMIYLPPRIPMLLLSATIGNSKQIADWLYSIRKVECTIIEETKRSVPLHTLFFHPSGTLTPFVVNKANQQKTFLHKRVNEFIIGKNPPVLCPPGKLPPIGEVISVLNHYNLLPAIFFMKSRSDCDQAIQFYAKRPIFIEPERQKKLSIRISELLDDNPHIKNHKQRYELEHCAVGAHHSGQLPAWKIIIETLMSEGLLNAMFATSTVAAGVNFPARSVVILNSDRFNGVEFMSLSSTEFNQMTGRAGRRGMDNVGFAVALPGKFMNLRLMSKLVSAPPLPVSSQIKINFSMILNLLLSNSPEQIKELLNKSFASWMINKKRTAIKKSEKKMFAVNNQTNYLWQDFLLHLDFLKQEGFVDEKNSLTEDGIWASKLRIDTPLLVAEGFRLDIFPKKDPAILTAIIASFVNERDFTDTSLLKRNTPKKLLTAFLKVKRILTPFAHNMLDNGFDVSPLYLQPAVTLYAWTSGEKWDDVLRNAEIAEGDLSRLILRTADNLQHIANLSDHFPEIASTAKQAKEIIMRSPVITHFNK